ncbi:ATP-binding protein [Streptomyces carminius]|uniref:ATP-binding protein n=1 Tax=Streptomyces carminius TaxID=2665496 RepID=A0A2M8LRP6_9ACTN|nr:ATP-binding protein [Streptomyces carminius]
MIARRARPEGGAGGAPAAGPWRGPGEDWWEEPWEGAGGGPPAAGPVPDGGRADGPAPYRAPVRTPHHHRYEEPLRVRLHALRELVGLSRTRLDGEVLGEAGRILDEVAARRRLSGTYTVVAVAGATGSGKSTLFNTLAGVQLSETGIRRPTTGVPVACVWEGGRDGWDGWDGGADGLLERLGVPPRARRRVPPRDPALHGLVLVDLPDHDSAVPGHREQVDRLLRLVDAVVWVADPEKYADAVLHERYLRPLAGHAEVTFVVLNQIDRLPAEDVDTVMDDLRRLLDEDGMALGEHGEPGATVLALSALTGEGVGELRHSLGELVSGRRAAGLRLAADVDGAVARLRPVYVVDSPHGPAGLTERAREEFEDRLAASVGAAAAGQTAERLWLRHAEQACGTPWARLLRWSDERRGYGGRGGRGEVLAARTEEPAGPAVAVARPVLAQAVRTLAEEASAGLPRPWARSVREAAWRGARGLPEALEEAIAGAGEPVGGPGCAAYGAAGGVSGGVARHRGARHRGVRGGVREAHGERPFPRPRWWTVAAACQALLLAAQLLGGWLLVDLLVGGPGRAGVWPPVSLLVGGALGGPLLAWCCRLAARGPARAYGLERERGLRRLATGWGQAWVLEPVAAELLRYREVREQYAVAAGGTVRT